MGKSNGYKTRNPVKQAPAISAETLAIALLRGPEDVFAAATREADARLEYEGHLAAISVRALSEPLFPGKTPGDPLRIAGNEDERRRAVDLTAHSDQLYIDLRRAHEAAQRDLALCRDRLKSAQLAARLIIRG